MWTYKVCSVEAEPIRQVEEGVVVPWIRPGPVQGEV